MISVYVDLTCYNFTEYVKSEILHNKFSLRKRRGNVHFIFDKYKFVSKSSPQKSDYYQSSGMLIDGLICHFNRTKHHTVYSNDHVVYVELLNTKFFRFLTYKEVERIIKLKKI